MADTETNHCRRQLWQYINESFRDPRIMTDHEQCVRLNSIRRVLDDLDRHYTKFIESLPFYAEDLPVAPYVFDTTLLYKKHEDFISPEIRCMIEKLCVDALNWNSWSISYADELFAMLKEVKDWLNFDYCPGRRRMWQHFWKRSRHIIDIAPHISQSVISKSGSIAIAASNNEDSSEPLSPPTSQSGSLGRKNLRHPLTPKVEDSFDDSARTMLDEPLSDVKLDVSPSTAGYAASVSSNDSSDYSPKYARSLFWDDDATTLVAHTSPSDRSSPTSSDFSTSDLDGKNAQELRTVYATMLDEVFDAASPAGSAASDRIHCESPRPATSGNFSASDLEGKTPEELASLFNTAIGKLQDATAGIFPYIQPRRKYRSPPFPLSPVDDTPSRFQPSPPGALPIPRLYVPPKTPLRSMKEFTSPSSASTADGSPSIQSATFRELLELFPMPRKSITYGLCNVYWPGKWTADSDSPLNTVYDNSGFLVNTRVNGTHNPFFTPTSPDIEPFPGFYPLPPDFPHFSFSPVTPTPVGKKARILQSPVSPTRGQSASISMADPFEGFSPLPEGFGYADSFARAPEVGCDSPGTKGIVKARQASVEDCDEDDEVGRTSLP